MFVYIFLTLNRGANYLGRYRGRAPPDDVNAIIPSDKRDVFYVFSQI